SLLSSPGILIGVGSMPSLLGGRVEKASTQNKTLSQTQSEKLLKETYQTPF
ncbi:uncharacterized protein METZ01_LOCUS439924, partial [marine metagenome]